jgi:phage terminase large subunit
MLLVSRDDIDRIEITEYSAAERFIKLPITNYLKLLTFDGKVVYDELNRPQTALINAVNSPKYRFICAALSRRLGKTFIANIIGQLVVLIPGSNVLIMSPNYNLSAISFELQRKLIKHFDLEVEKDNLKDKVIELANGSTIRMGSLSTVDSSVGRSYNLIIFDEAALGSDGEAAFNVSLRPTLDRANSKAIFISTPRGKHNWFSKFWQRGFEEDYPEWVSLQADYTENDRMTEADVTEARRSMSKAEFDQEYLASFNTFEGQIFASFDSSQIVEFEHSDGLEYIAGLDPGYRDPTAFVVVAYDPKIDKFHVVDEYQESEATTEGHAAAINELVMKYGIESIFIDSAAAQFAGDLAYTYDIASIKAKKQVLEGIAYVQTIVDQGRLLVAPHCTHTLKMLDQYQWDKNTALQREKPNHDMNSHIADALRYCLYTFTL